MIRPITLIVALSSLLVACSGLKTYRSDYQKNLFIATDTETRGWFSGVDASLDIYQMQGDCDVDYQGTVILRDSLVEVGVPAEQAAYLVFRFERSEFLSNTQSAIGYNAALYSVDGFVYDVNVTYRDNIYNVEVQERERGGINGQRLAIGMVERGCESDS